MNEASFDYYYENMACIAQSVFQWINLPNSIDVVSMERMLYNRGNICIFFDEILEQWLALPFVYSGNFDVYGYPYKRTVFSNYNSYRKTVTPENSVIIFDSRYRNMQTYECVYYYAQRLWDIDRTIDINAHAQKTPPLFTSDKATRMAIKNAYQQWDGNMPALAINKKLDTKNVVQYFSNPPFIGAPLYELRANIWNDFLTSIGVPNSSIHKKERLTSDESRRLSGGSIASRYPRLDCREYAVNQLNDLKLWRETVGDKVEVSYQQELDTGGEVSDGSEIHDSDGRNNP